MSQEGWMFTNAEEAMQFYELCEALGAKTRKERTAVLRELVKNRQATYLRDVETYAKNKRVLKIKMKESPND